MAAKKLFNKLNGEGYPITLDESHVLYNKYCKEYRTGIDFLRESGRRAVEQGFVTNLNGRRRHWLMPDPHDLTKYPNGKKDFKYRNSIGGIEREGGNFPIQSVNADLTKYSMVCIRDYIKKNKVRSGIMMQVYDEVVTCTHKDDSEAFHAAKTNIMIQAAARWIDSVPIEVDGHVLPYWTK